MAGPARVHASPTPSDRAAGIVVIQEWWGVNDQIKAVAERLAMGYRDRRWLF